jgi:hypothetical protein
MSGGLVAGVAALASAAPVAAAGVAADGERDTLVAGAVADLGRTIERQAAAPWRGIARVREQQRLFLRSAGRYPEYVEVGVQVWEAVHDWHVTYRQPLSMTRASDGRYTMAFMFTTLLLRPDLDPDYVGYPFDTDRPRAAP